MGLSEVVTPGDATQPQLSPTVFTTGVTMTGSTQSPLQTTFKVLEVWSRLLLRSVEHMNNISGEILLLWLFHCPSRCLLVPNVTLLTLEDSKEVVTIYGIRIDHYSLSSPEPLLKRQSKHPSIQRREDVSREGEDMYAIPRKVANSPP